MWGSNSDGNGDSNGNSNGNGNGNVDSDGDGDNDSDDDSMSNEECNGDIDPLDLLDQDEDVIWDAEEVQEGDIQEAADAAEGAVMVMENEQNATSTALSKVNLMPLIVSICWLCMTAHQTHIQNQQLTWPP